MSISKRIGGRAFSLLEILIAAGLLLGLSVIAAKLLGYSGQSTRETNEKSSLRNEAMVLMSKLQTDLSASPLSYFKSYSDGTDTTMGMVKLQGVDGNLQKIWEQHFTLYHWSKTSQELVRFENPPGPPDLGLDWTTGQPPLLEDDLLAVLGAQAKDHCVTLSRRAHEFEAIASEGATMKIRVKLVASNSVSLVTEKTVRMGH